MPKLPDKLVHVLSHRCVWGGTGCGTRERKEWAGPHHPQVLHGLWATRGIPVIGLWGLGMGPERMPPPTHTFPNRYEPSVHSAGADALVGDDMAVAQLLLASQRQLQLRQAAQLSSLATAVSMPSGAAPANAVSAPEPPCAPPSLQAPADTAGPGTSPLRNHQPAPEPPAGAASAHPGLQAPDASAQSSHMPPPAGIPPTSALPQQPSLHEHPSLPQQPGNRRASECPTPSFHLPLMAAPGGSAAGKAPPPSSAMRPSPLSPQHFTSPQLRPLGFGATPMTAAPATFPRHDAAAARLSLTPMTLAVQQQGGCGGSSSGGYDGDGLGPAPLGWRREAERTMPGDLHPEVLKQPPVSIGTKRQHPEEEAAAAVDEGRVDAARSGAFTEGVTAEEGKLPVVAAATIDEPHVDDIGTEQGCSPKRPRQGPDGATTAGARSAGAVAEGGVAASLSPTTQAAAAVDASRRGKTAPGADRQPLLAAAAPNGEPGDASRRGETATACSGAGMQSLPAVAAPNGAPGGSHVVELYLARLVLYELVDLAQYPHEV